jgi:hypothetical protein
VIEFKETEERLNGISSNSDRALKSAAIPIELPLPVSSTIPFSLIGGLAGLCPGLLPMPWLKHFTAVILCDILPYGDGVMIVQHESIDAAKHLGCLQTEGGRYLLPYRLPNGCFERRQRRFHKVLKRYFQGVLNHSNVPNVAGNKALLTSSLTTSNEVLCTPVSPNTQGCNSYPTQSSVGVMASPSVVKETSSLEVAAKSAEEPQDVLGNIVNKTYSIR